MKRFKNQKQNRKSGRGLGSQVMLGQTMNTSNRSIVNCFGNKSLQIKMKSLPINVCGKSNENNNHLHF